MDVPYVLSVEDNDGDFMLIEMALHDCVNPLDLRRASDGDQAVAFLQRSGSRGERCPDLVLLDINLPSLNGLSILQFIKSQDFIRDIPVVMFTSSSKEKKKALALGAHDFITKPMDLTKLLQVLNEVCAKYLKKAAGPE